MDIPMEAVDEGSFDIVSEESGDRSKDGF